MLRILCFESAGFFFVSDKSGAVFFSTTMMRRNKKFQNKPRRIPPFQSETYNYIIASFRNFSATNYYNQTKWKGLYRHTLCSALHRLRIDKWSQRRICWSMVKSSGSESNDQKKSCAFFHEKEEVHIFNSNYIITLKFLNSVDLEHYSRLCCSNQLTVRSRAILMTQRTCKLFSENKRSSSLVWKIRKQRPQGSHVDVSRLESRRRNFSQ